MSKFQVKLVRDNFSFVDSLNCSWTAAFANERELEIRRLDGTGWRKVFDFDPAGPVCPLAWSPDAKTIYYGGGQKLIGLDLESGKSRVIHRFSEEEKISIHWHLECSPHNISFYSVYPVRKERKKIGKLTRREM